MLDLMMNSFGRIYVLCAVAMSALFFGSGWAMSVWAGFEQGAALGLAAFCAAWGGPGFGAMAAGAVMSFNADEH